MKWEKWTIAHIWCDGHFTNKIAYGVLGARARVQNFHEEISHTYTYIMLEYNFISDPNERERERYVFFFFFA